MDIRQEFGPLHVLPRILLGAAIAVQMLIVPGIAHAQNASRQITYDDHQNMMDQLGVKAIRRGPDPNNQSTFDEAIANPYKDSMMLTLPSIVEKPRKDDPTASGVARGPGMTAPTGSAEGAR